jgi:hypothetical protein
MKINLIMKDYLQRKNFIVSYHNVGQMMRIISMLAMCIKN